MSKGIVTRLSLDRLKAGIFGAIVVLLAVVAFAKRRTCVLYSVKKERIATTDGSIGTHGWAIWRTVAPLIQSLSTLWCHLGLAGFGSLTIMTICRSMAILRCT